MYKKSRSEGFGEEVKRRIMLGSFVLSSGYYDAYYLKALRTKALIKQAFDRAFEKYDVILGPVAPTTAPKLGASLKDPLQDVPWRYLYGFRQPGGTCRVLSVPCGKDSERTSDRRAADRRLFPGKEDPACRICVMNRQEETAGAGAGRKGVAKCQDSMKP